MQTKIGGRGPYARGLQGNIHRHMREGFIMGSGRAQKIDGRRKTGGNWEKGHFGREWVRNTGGISGPSIGVKEYRGESGPREKG